MNQPLPKIVVASEGISYKITPSVLKTFADPSKPFLSFDQFVNIAQWYRDDYYARDHVPGFDADIGTAYLVWTRHTSSSYFRHIFPDQLTKDLTISFEIPHLEHASWFPLVIKVFDEDGLYFLHEQQLVIERNVGGRFMLSSWRRVPGLRAFLTSQVPQEPRWVA